MRILIVRNDRLGDALLALPSLLAVRKAFEDASIDFVCHASVVEAVKPWLVSIRIGPVTSVARGSLKETYDAILFLHDDEKLMLNSWREGVRLRVGVYSRASSFLFLNRGLVQRRSRALKNEGEYNLDLAHFLIRKLGRQDSPIAPEKICLPVNVLERKALIERLEAMGIRPEVPYVVVHPGMGGSALNLSVSAYVRIGRHLQQAGIPFVISQGPSEIDERVAGKLKTELPKVPLISKLTLRETMELFRMARWVVAPSTGPLHLAHYVGAETIGIYSPVLAHHFRRWAPWGGTGVTQIVSPDVECKAVKDCLKEKCPSYYCMDQLGPERFPSLSI